jgi:solute carrier family 25 2-oxodicarboxylate transporter 21
VATRSSCVVREAIYTAGYLGLAPVAKGRLEAAHPFFKSNDTLTEFVSACIGGTTAAMLTHPVDTAKTCIQV